ncbi:MAG: M20 family metallopeptidase [Candidatus Helarchaeota archaeon]
MDTILNSIEKNKDKIFRYLSSLIKFKTINPSKDYIYEINNIIEFTRDYLEDLGAKCEVLKESSDIPILICNFKGNNSNKKMIWNGHFDVVPIGDINVWDVDPFEGYIKNDKMIGRGATDMKGSIAAALFAISNVIDHGEIKSDLSFIFTCDEETGSKSLSKAIGSKIFDATACIVGEPSSCKHWGDGISIGESGIIWLKLILKGKTSHASLNFLGDNAIEKLDHFLSSLHKLRNIKQPIFKRYVPIINEVLDGSSPRFLKFYEKNLKNIRLTPTIIKGGVKLNVIPDRVELDLDIRILPGSNTNRIFNYIKKTIKNSGLNDFSLKLMQIQQPSISKSNLPFIKMVKNSADLISKNYSFMIHPACTDARFFRKFMPTVTLGCGDVQRAHSINEYVTFHELIEMSKIYATIFQKF